jgi:hypothetical protein
LACVENSKSYAAQKKSLPETSSSNVKPLMMSFYRVEQAAASVPRRIRSPAAWTRSAILADTIRMSRLGDGDRVDNRAGGKGEGQRGDDEELAHDRNSICWIHHIAKWHRRCDGDHAIAHLPGRDRW